MNLRRIRKELFEFARDPPDCVSAGPVNKEDLSSWEAEIKDLVPDNFASEINIFLERYSLRRWSL